MRLCEQINVFILVAILIDLSLNLLLTVKLVLYSILLRRSRKSLKICLDEFVFVLCSFARSFASAALAVFACVVRLATKSNNTFSLAERYELSELGERILCTFASIRSD